MLRTGFRRTVTLNANTTYAILLLTEEDVQTIARPDFSQQRLSRSLFEIVCVAERRITQCTGPDLQHIGITPKPASRAIGNQRLKHRNQRVVFVGHTFRGMLRRCVKLRYTNVTKTMPFDCSVVDNAESNTATNFTLFFIIKIDFMLINKKLFQG